MLVNFSKKKNLTSGEYTVILLCLLVSFQAIKEAFILLLRSIVKLPLTLDTVILYCLLAYIIVKSIPNIYINMSNRVYFYILYFLTYLLISSINLSSTEHFVRIGTDLFISIIGYIIASSITDFNYLQRSLNIVSFLITISMFFLIVIFNVYGDLNYSQTLAYLTLPAAIISANALFEKLNFYQLINFITSNVLIFISGARGPLIATGLFLLLRTLGSLSSKNNRFYLLIMMSFIFGIIIFYSNTILHTLDFIVSKYSFSSRLVNFFNNEQILQDDGRNRLWQCSYDILSHYPAFGVGLGCERYLLNSMVYGSPYSAMGNYPHNIFLELLVQYGIIIGTAIIIYFSYMIVRALLNSKDRSYKNIVMIFIGIGFFPLLFSGSYINAPLLFALLGFCSTNNGYNKNLNRISL